MWNNEWIKGQDYPEWGETEVYKKTISGGYLLNGETPRDGYASLVRSYQTLGRIADFLLVVLVLT